MGKRRVRERILQTSDIRKEEPGKDTENQEKIPEEWYLGSQRIFEGRECLSW